MLQKSNLYAEGVLGAAKTTVPSIQISLPGHTANNREPKMSGNVEDFLNPKSMPTPAAAGAIVALISGALFKNFGMSVAVCTVALSFLVGLIVFQSREFKGTSMSKLTKIIFYSINSLIIFAMATGTTSVMAEEIFVQERPYFYDWTKQSNDDPNQNIPAVNKNFDISVQVMPGRSKGIKKILESKGILTKDYATQVTIVPNNDTVNLNIESVIFKLPEDSFKKSKINLSADQVDDGINIKAWKSFQIEADVTTTTGESFKIYKHIDPGLMVQPQN